MEADSPGATYWLQSDVSPSPQSNLMLTLSLSGSVAADEKLAGESFATADGPEGTDEERTEDAENTEHAEDK